MFKACVHFLTYQTCLELNILNSRLQLKINILAKMYGFLINYMQKLNRAKVMISCVNEHYPTIAGVLMPF